MRAAVIGTGIMGTGMAHSLRRQGFDVVVWNRSADKARAVGHDTVVAATPAEAVRDCDVVFTMLSAADAVEAVAEQFLDHLGNALWLQSSTVGVEGTKRLLQLANKCNAAYIECPVSGTKQPAENGQSAILAAGPTNLRSRAQPAFDAIGSRTVWVGEDPVQASLMKLVVNNWVIGLTSVLAETVTLAETAGLDPQMFLDVIQGAASDSPYAHLKGALMLERDYPASFPLNLAAKDARLIAEAADDYGLRLPVNAAVTALYASALADHGERDMSAVIETVRTS